MGNPVPHDGNLLDTSPCEVLAAICEEGVTGVLTFQSPGVEKSVFLQSGKIVFAASRDPDDRLGELLLTRSVITREQMDLASSKIVPGKRLGTVLVELGFLQAAELPHWVREQVKEIVFSLFSWGEGEYRFVPGPLPSGEVITLKISTAEIFMTGLRRVQKWSVLRKGAGETQIPYRLASDFRHLLKDVHLGNEEESLLLLVESGSNTMEEAARNSTLTTLLVYQLFFAFRVLGILLPPDHPSFQQKKETPHKSPPPRRVPDPAEERPAAPGETVRLTLAVESPGGHPPANRGGKPVQKGKAPEPRRLSSPAPPRRPAEPGPEGRTADAEIPVLQDSPGALPAVGKQASLDSAALPAREYQVVRLEGEKLDGNGGPQIEKLLDTWSRKGYSLAGVVPGRPSSSPQTAVPSYFIFVRE